MKYLFIISASLSADNKSVVRTSWIASGSRFHAIETFKTEIGKEQTKWVVGKLDCTKIPPEVLEDIYTHNHKETID